MTEIEDLKQRLITIWNKNEIKASRSKYNPYIYSLDIDLNDYQILHISMENRSNKDVVDLTPIMSSIFAYSVPLIKLIGRGGNIVDTKEVITHYKLLDSNVVEIIRLDRSVDPENPQIVSRMIAGPSDIKMHLRTLMDII